MIKSLFMLALACAPAQALATHSSFAEHSAHGNRVLVSTVQKSDRRHLIFPAQKSLHKLAVAASVQEAQANIHSEDIMQLDDSFWQKHAELLNLAKDSNMVLDRSWNAAGSDVVHQRFHQTKHGLRVVGGEFIASLGAHGGVMRVNGLPITAEVAASEIEAAQVTEDDVIVYLEKYISNRMDKKQFPIGGSSKVELLSAPELVWHNSLYAVAKEGKITLAYQVNGIVGKSSSGEILAFDAFVSAHSGEVLQFLDKSQRGETSPFSSPLQNASIFVYDQWRKDLNDDQDDYYYSPDPDRYSNLTLVFDTETGLGYPYPTTDYEMNELIDNTLYVKYMYYSLSGGEYLTWNLTETDLNIEYNLSIANAFFDGYWGIHFGTGYITDDVVPHEWSHGYTQTGCGLIYAYESGAMNEAFSDIYGESVDILNRDTTDPDVHRTAWPTTCHQTLNSPGGIPPGNDFGTRWSMGENVTTSYPNGDGSIRDMYRPECFFQPSTTDADYYSCTTYADSGGVHKNSGVLNRLYAVLTDGGEYANPADPSQTLVINALGFTKSTNLFWRTHQVLTPTSQYMDFTIAIAEVCEENIGAVLFVPNLFNYTITEADETLTEEDCNNVALAVVGSGMDSTADFCPNIACDPDNQYDCEWVNCTASDTTLFYEDYDYYMGLNGVGSLTAVCAGEGQTSSYARVFEQDRGIELNISCIQFGYFMNGQTDVTLSLYMDSNGGDPDADMVLIDSVNVTTINAVGQFQVQTASFNREVPIVYDNKHSTLVVVLSTPVMSEGSIIGGGTPNDDIVKTIGDTYVGGDCMEYIAYYDYAKANNLGSKSSNQWFVKLSGSSVKLPHSGDDDDDALSDGAIAGIAIGSVAGLAVLGAGGYFVYSSVAAGGAASTKTSLLENAA